MHPVIQDVCQRYGFTREELMARGNRNTLARVEAIRRLDTKGMSYEHIAREVGCHVQTVYYWIRPARRAGMIQKSILENKIRQIPGPRQSKASRDEILQTYLADRASGTALAVRRGLSPLYAHKLALAMGVL